MVQKRQPRHAATKPGRTGQKVAAVTLVLPILAVAAFGTHQIVQAHQRAVAATQPATFTSTTTAVGSNDNGSAPHSLAHREGDVTIIGDRTNVPHGPVLAVVYGPPSTGGDTINVRFYDTGGGFTHEFEQKMTNPDTAVATLKQAEFLTVIKNGSPHAEHPPVGPDTVYDNLRITTPVMSAKLVEDTINIMKTAKSPAAAQQRVVQLLLASAESQ